MKRVCAISDRACAMALIGCILLVACGTDDLSDDETMAVALCHNHIKDQLRSPATARFSDNYFRAVTEVDDDEYMIESWVESKNIFDTRLQFDYACHIKKDEDGWTLLDLFIDWDNEWVVE